MNNLRRSICMDCGKVSHDQDFLPTADPYCATDEVVICPQCGTAAPMVAVCWKCDTVTGTSWLMKDGGFVMSCLEHKPIN